MKRKPLLINVARGALIVEADLVDALDRGLVAGAALDVLAEDSPDLGHHPLVRRSEVLLTPHIAFYSESALEDLRRISASNIREFLEGRPDQRVPARRANGMSGTGHFRRRARARHDQFQRRPALGGSPAARAARQCRRALLRRRRAARAELWPAPGRCALPRGTGLLPRRVRGQPGGPGHADADGRHLAGARLRVRPLHAAGRHRLRRGAELSLFVPDLPRPRARDRRRAGRRLGHGRRGSASACSCNTRRSSCTRSRLSTIPTGQTLDFDRRERLVELSRKHGFVIVADEVYQLLHHGTPPPPSFGTLGAGGQRALARHLLEDPCAGPAPRLDPDARRSS